MEYMEKYLKWLKDGIVERRLHDGWTEIATPFMDCHNDGLVVYEKKENGEITLTDDGDIIGDMEMSGMPINLSAIQKLCTEYGVTVTKDKQLQTKATAQTYAPKFHLLIQAMMEASASFCGRPQNRFE